MLCIKNKLLFIIILFSTISMYAMTPIENYTKLFKTYKELDPTFSAYDQKLLSDYISSLPDNVKKDLQDYINSDQKDFLPLMLVAAIAIAVKYDLRFMLGTELENKFSYIKFEDLSVLSKRTPLQNWQDELKKIDTDKKASSFADLNPLKLLHQINENNSTLVNSDPLLLQKFKEYNLKEVENEYKIHFIPKGFMISTLDKLFNIITNNNDVKQRIFSVKIILISDKELERYKQISPKVVIYVNPYKIDSTNLNSREFDGKANTEKLLTIFLQEFKGIEGLNILLPFNEKFSSLIYAAQNDSGNKSNRDLNKYFEKPKKIYLDPYLSDKYNNYHLKPQRPIEPPKVNIVPESGWRATFSRYITRTNLLFGAGVMSVFGAALYYFFGDQLAQLKFNK